MHVCIAMLVDMGGIEVNVEYGWYGMYDLVCKIWIGGMVCIVWSSM